MHYRYLDASGNGIIDVAAQWTHGGITHPKNALARKPTESEQVWVARLNSMGVQPVQYMESQHNPLTERQGSAVGTEVDGYWLISFPVPEPITAMELIAAKRAEIVSKADAFMTGLTATYSEHEKLSWAKQEAEAKALAADPDAAAPLLSGIAATRGIAREVLRDKVLANVATYESVSAAVLGTQQLYEDQLAAAGDDAGAIVTIDPVYTLPA